MFNISGREIGATTPTFIIAEMSANHNHDFEIAAKTLVAMKEAGADAVKLQTYTADTITCDARNEYFQIDQGTIWDGRNLHDLYKEAYTPWEWHPKLQNIAKDLGLIFFSTPFDPTAVDFLENLNVPVYKVASFEITDIPLIENIARRGKPMIMSTGIAEMSDIEDALDACKRMSNNQIALLKCTSAYPAPYGEANLRTIPDMIERFGVVAGLSDHTLGSHIPSAAVALGARIIEKHFIVDRSIGGPDASFSLEPHEFKSMVSMIRNVEEALGTATYELTKKARISREFCRSLFAVEDIQAGEKLTSQNVRSIRPGYGLMPKHLPEILGKQATQFIAKGTPLQWELIR